MQRGHSLSGRAVLAPLLTLGFYVASSSHCPKRFPQFQGSMYGATRRFI